MTAPLFLRRAWLPWPVRTTNPPMSRKITQTAFPEPSGTAYLIDT